MSTAPITQSEPGLKNTAFGFIKDSSRQLSDGYLSKTPLIQYLLVSICFPMWGAAASLNDILITQFKSIFELSDLASAFVQSAFYGGYFFLAIPASRIIGRWSYKSGILIGLTFYIVGCTMFFPASRMATYSVFLAALFAVAIGLSFLETSCNTYSTMLGPKRLATLRLNISQTFYPLGSIFGVLLGKFLIFTGGDPLKDQLGAVSGAEKQALAEELLQRTLGPYRVIIIILAVLLLLVALTQMPHGKPYRGTTEVRAKLGETVRYLAHNARFRQGIVTEFFYVGMQTALWSFTIRLALTLDPNLSERSASDYMIWAYIAFFLGKVIANVLITRFSENHVLMGFTAFGVLTIIYVVTVPSLTAVYGCVLASGLFGPCWATIYASTLDAVTDKRHTETAGAVIVMSIVGGAVIPAIQGWVSDTTGSMQTSFLVDGVCFAIVFVYFFFRNRAAGAQR